MILKTLRNIVFLITFLFVFLSAVYLSAQEITPAERWSVVTRLDYRVWIDGKYSGFADSQIREIYEKLNELPDGWNIGGSVYVLGKLKKDGKPVAAKLEESEKVNFVLKRNGAIEEEKADFPLYRGFPVFPVDQIKPGDSWEAPLEMLVRGTGGEKGVIKLLASYNYIERKQYNGIPADFFYVQWAMRYRGGNEQLDDFLKSAEGSHKVTLVVNAETGMPLMARDNIKEEWVWQNLQIEKRDGFALIFWKDYIPMDKIAVLNKVKDAFPEYSDIKENNTDNNITFSGKENGVSITLNNLHFEPDKAVILKNDLYLLDKIAEILKQIPDKTVIVRGHTASVGRPEDELLLSEKRAQVVADELSKRGIAPERLIYEGVGSKEPVASNDSEEGRKRNRRVEFFILDD
jgi:outer membrane protein OmpA-like peptidoglycan-associated protein